MPTNDYPTSTDSTQTSATKNDVTKPNSIDDALKVLDEALVGQNTDLSDLVSAEMAQAKSSFQSSSTSPASSSGSSSVASSAAGPSSDALGSITEAVRAYGAQALSQMTSKLSDLSTGASSGDLTSHLSQIFTGQFDKISGVATPGIERGREALTHVDARVRSNPWPVIGGIAVGALALGFLIGRSNETTTTTSI